MVRIITAFFSLLLFSFTLASQNSECLSRQCTAIIDAGSTGSRIHIYAYDKDTNRTPTNITELWSKKIKPGFASIEANTKEIDNYLETLLNDAPIKDIPIYFYATAGMRLQPITKQSTYYKELSRWFSAHNEWILKDAKTITGKEEGLYDWLSVNYYLGTLNTKEIQPVGVMDMGGASVQIAFPVTKEQAIDPENIAKIELYGHTYTLYVKSFLGLGQTELSHQFLNTPSCFSSNYPLPDGGQGNGNAQSCEQEVVNLVNQIHNVAYHVQPVLKLNPVYSWYSLGGLTSLANSQPFHFTNSELTSSTLLQQGDSEICQQSWGTLLNQFPNDDYLYGYCLTSAAYYALIVEGYGIAPDQPIHYLTSPSNVDWTTGVILQIH